MNKTLLFILLCLISPRVFASHLVGADIRYEFDGTNYTIYLTMAGDCSGAGLSGTQAVLITSASLSNTMQVTCTLTNQNPTLACPTLPNTCQSSTSMLPGFKAAVYTATVTLPAANDWVISHTSSARGSVNNLLNSTSTNLHVEARLDNSTAINSNPIVSGLITHLGIANSPLVVPLQAADAEGDSIAYELITPMASSTTNAAWATGFSLTNPLGSSGVCSVNNANKTLVMMSPLIGQYAIALKVKEYRNGNLIASYVKDFLYLTMSGSGSITVPAPPANMTVYTCPGQSHNVSLTFTDAGGDSVLLNITSPVMTGWSFSTSTSSSPGSGTANISWTTPSGMNPATLPYFYVKIKAQDNACPKSVMDYILVVRTQQCASDSVWPGDANGDYTVNIYDPLALAIAMGQTGPARSGASLTWIAQPCANWTNSFVTNNVNMKHADCDGNGTVTTADLGAVTTNWGQVHLKGEFHNKVTGAPPFYFDLAGIALTPGANVSIPIKLGDATTPMTDIYGLATQITVNGISMGSPSVSTTTSWLGNSSNTLNFTKPGAGKIEWAHARTNHTEINGDGTIGMLNFTVPANATPGTSVTFSFANTVMVDKDGVPVTGFDEQDASATIPVGIDDVNSAGLHAAVVPNPSHAGAHLQLTLSQPSDIGISITDLAGRLVWQHSSRYGTGESRIALPVTLSAGVYMIGLTNGNQSMDLVKWIKQ